MHTMSRSSSSGSEDSVLLIGVMGVTGSGKSSFASLASGDPNITVGTTLRSCTKDVQASHVFEVDGRKVQLVDTPGFNDDNLSDADILDLIADWMKSAFDDNQKLHGIMYLHRITDGRMDGGAVRSLKLFRNICGPDFYQNTIMFTTMWDMGNNDTAFLRAEKELKDDHWQELMVGGAMYARGYNRKEDCSKILSRIVQKQGRIANMQDEVGSRGLDVGETDAGKGLYTDIGKELEKMKKIFEERYMGLVEESRSWATEKQVLMDKLDRLEKGQAFLMSRRGKRGHKDGSTRGLKRSIGRRIFSLSGLIGSK